MPPLASPGWSRDGAGPGTEPPMVPGEKHLKLTPSSLATPQETESIVKRQSKEGHNPLRRIRIAALMISFPLFCSLPDFQG